MSRVAESRHGIGRVAHVAGAHHGDVDAPGRAVDDLPVGLARVGGHPRAPVDREHLHATVLCQLGHLHDVQAIAIPPGPGLQRDGDVDGLHHRSQDGFELRAFPHQLGAAATLDHLGDGAARVDVEDVGAALLDDLGRQHHAVEIGAEDLDGDGSLVLPVAQHLMRAEVVAREALHRDELANQEADRARSERPDGAPEGRVGDPRHGGEDEARIHTHGPDIEGWPHG
jgi:hypothetical protein